jgi:LmbE family N-acetylglucosaminyl deacetylase
LPTSHRLMCILAHPDDESLGAGGTLARYASEGVETYLITATRGDRGRFYDQPERPDRETVGRVREAELRAAARELGVREVVLLDYLDQELDQADSAEAIGSIAGHIRRIKPQVVITFGPEGGYGHPDHIAISQFATAALVCAADPDYPVPANGSHAHRVSKLYYMAWAEPQWRAYQAAFRDLKTTVDGIDRRATPWPEWALTTTVDTRDYWRQVWKAVECHQTQMAIYSNLADLSEEYHQALWGSQEFYRVYSCVNGGRRRETDLFEGLRPKSAGNEIPETGRILQD